MSGKVNRIWAIVLRHLYVWPRNLESLIESFWWPSFDVFLWGLMTVYLSSKEGVPNYFTAFIIGAITLWMFVYRSQQEIAFTFLKEFWDRNLLSIMTTPITIWEFQIATLILGLFKLALSGIWMGILGYFLFSFNIFRFGWYLIPFLCNLFLVGWTAGFIVNSLIIRYGYRVQAFAWSLIIIIQPFSAVYYPVSTMPYWMQEVARFVPTSYIFEGMRSVIREGTMNFGALGFATILNVFYLALSLFFFSWSFGKARENGMIVKFN